MTQNQYNELAENFYKYANKTCEYESYVPSTDKYLKANGILLGIGVGANQGCLIIGSCGYRHAIRFERVKRMGGKA